MTWSDGEAKELIKTVQSIFKKKWHFPVHYGKCFLEMKCIKKE